MVLRPSWLIEDCPAWCTREHHEDDFSDDRYHLSEPSVIPVLVVIEQGVHITSAMHGHDLVVWTGRYVGEAFDWIVIEPEEQREPRLVLSAESAALLVGGIAEQLRLTGRVPVALPSLVRRNP